MMQTEFYRSQTGSRPTFSFLVAVSFAGLNAVAQPPAPPGHRVSERTPPPLALHAYYEPAETTLALPGQSDALRRFAESLIAGMEDSPQAVIETLNRHFWDLV